MTRSLVIGGTTRAGKSTLARRLTSEFGLPRISGDSLVFAFGTAFPSLNINHEQPQPVTAANMASFVAEYWSRLLAEGDSPGFIYDSFHLLPSCLPLDKLREKLDFVFLGYPRIEVEDMLVRLRSQKEEKGWTSRLTNDQLRPELADMIAISQRLESECQEHNLPFFDVSRSWEEGGLAAYCHMAERLDPSRKLSIGNPSGSRFEPK